FAPPFRGALSCHAKQIRSQCALLRRKAVGTSPHVGKGLLQHIFRRLASADDLAEKPEQRRCHLPVKRIEGLRITAANPIPQFGVLSQRSSPSSYSGLLAKKFMPHRNCVGASSERPTARCGCLCGLRRVTLVIEPGAIETFALNGYC